MQIQGCLFAGIVETVPRGSRVCRLSSVFYTPSNELLGRSSLQVNELIKLRCGFEFEWSVKITFCLGNSCNGTSIYHLTSLIRFLCGKRL